MPVALCRSIRTASVFIPRSISQAQCGSSACPHTFMRSRTSSTNGSEPATAPAITSVWPLRYLVTLWMTTSAPCSSGRKLMGEANVESTSSGTPRSLVSRLSQSRSSSRMMGLVGVSTKMARVFLRQRERQSRRLSGLTNETSIPSRFRSSVNSRRVPP